MDKEIAETMKYLLPALIIGVLGIVGMFVFWRGKQSKANEIRLGKKHAYAERLASEYDSVLQLYDRLRSSAQKCFGHFQNLAEAGHEFETRPMYEEMRQEAQKLLEHQLRMREAIQNARAYLQPANLDEFERLLDSFAITWQDDAGPEISRDYYGKLLANWLNDDLHKRRIDQQSRLTPSLRKLAS